MKYITNQFCFLYVWYKKEDEYVTLNVKDFGAKGDGQTDGHGAITIGSEMAGGVKNLNVEDCLFLHTDRGLRIKTRRGRGKDAIVTGIRLCLFVCINYYSVEEL